MGLFMFGRVLISILFSGVLFNIFVRYYRQRKSAKAAEPRAKQNEEWKS